ncbi:hypothetical protein [Streptantibioticus silvisoli]|uniref:MarR family transcriptional regulator n=1 Tax=Streptantibioticus silvisoli TaxID=2705255 RepID=A0ABT6VVP9_9ACTN|nr:hypothetical protein [Streptantibioticus silvisoli]MDI5962104.1 hypothetical protein [Streptantibioticus silvisoli]
MPELVELRDLWKQATLRRRTNRSQKRTSRRDLSAATVVAQLPQQLEVTPSGEYAVRPVLDRQKNVVPVEDRPQNGSKGTVPARPQWTASAAVQSMVTAIAAHRAAGRRQDVLGLIWAAGSSLTARQIAESTDVFRELGDAEVEAGLVRSASRRPAADVMRIAAELITLGRPETASAILAAAIPK